MLRITVHEDGKFCRLELAGRLDGPWVAETEHAWRSSLLSAREIELDMRQLTAVDEAGRELLLAMHLAGTRLVVEGVWMTALVDEITARHALEVNKRQTPRKKRYRRRIIPDQERSK